MASKTAAAKAAAPEDTSPVISVESLYTVDELAACAKQVFNTNSDMVRAALRLAGVTKTTQNEAAKIVEAFRKKEV